MPILVVYHPSNQQFDAGYANILALVDPALVAKILQSDALMVKTEEEVLTAVRRWVIHDEDGIESSYDEP